MDDPRDDAEDSREMDQDVRQTPTVPISAAEIKLMQELQARQGEMPVRKEERKILGAPPAPPTSAPPKELTDSLTAFPDLPPELKPQRPDGTGVLTYRDIEEMERMGTTPLLTKVAAKQAKVAVDHLEQKMSRTAEEFGQGRINNAQFQAVYMRYAEQRAMIERMRSSDPSSLAWRDKMPARGETAFLRKQYAAHMVGCLIVQNAQAKIIRTFGTFDLQGDLLTPMLSNLQRPLIDSPDKRQRSTQIEGGRWVSIAPGEFTTTIAIFSHEPSAAQRTSLADVHQDFERANYRVLKLGQIQPSRLVYPQRMMFEEV
jgi:hypothetical protein